MIIAENDTAKLDADKKPLKDSKGFFIPDKITSYSAMAREAGWGDEIPALLRNENWQYALFNAAKQIRPNINYAECFACHKALSKTSFVFTLKHLAELQKPSRFAATQLRIIPDKICFIATAFIDLAIK